MICLLSKECQSLQLLEVLIKVKNRLWQDNLSFDALIEVGKVGPMPRLNRQSIQHHLMLKECLASLDTLDLHLLEHELFLLFKMFDPTLSLVAYLCD